MPPTEKDAIEARETPVTKESIREDLAALGISEGMVLFVQSSLSSMGWVCGGPVAVIQALIEAVGPSGTICMPAMTGDYSNPANWSNPPVPASWVETIRESIPLFDKEYTPTRAMGSIAETFRTWPGVRRSDHPHTSFTAHGAHAKHLTAQQPLSISLGPGSPLERMVELGGYALLIGTERNTTLHLAEALADFPKKPIITGAARIVDGKRKWVAFEELDYADHFPEILREFVETQPCTVGKIGNAKAVLFKQELMVAYGKAWMERHFV